MNRTSRLYLIRHGQVDGYERFPVYGHTDVNLTETGILQIRHLAERLRLVEMKSVYSSDLKRSADSARLIGQFHDVPIHSLPELREMYFGDWEGMTLEEIRKGFPEELKKRQSDLVHYRAPGNGESVKDFAERISSCFERIMKENSSEDMAIVAHGAVNRVILCNALGLDLSRMFNIHQDYGCLNIIDYFPDSILVRLMNG